MAILIAVRKNETLGEYFLRYQTLHLFCARLHEFLEDYRVLAHHNVYDLNTVISLIETS